MGLFSSIFGAKALKKANKRAMAEQTAGFNDAKGYLEPYQAAGNEGLGAYKDAIGLGDGNRAVASFENSPFYKLTHGAAIKAGQEGVMNMASGAGMARSGRTLAALADRARQDTNNSFQSYVNPLAGFSEMGLGVANNLGNLRTGHAANMAQGQLNKGQIKAGQFAGFDNILSGGMKLLGGM